MIKLTPEQIFPPLGSGILLGLSDNRIFEKGVATDRCDGIRCSVLSLAELKIVSIKVPGATPPITHKELSERAAAGQLTWVQFSGLEARYYNNSKTQRQELTGSATSVKICDAPVIFEVE